MRYFVTGTDTGVGKTVVAAWLMLHLDHGPVPLSGAGENAGAGPRTASLSRRGKGRRGARYWKPVQAGLEGEADADAVRRLAGLGDDRIVPAIYALPEPLAPHEAARRAGVAIELDRFALPDGNGPLVVEGAGGLLVPLNAERFMIDLMARLGLPAILVARTTLGTINHTLLSLEALRRRALPVAGVVLNGPDVPHNRTAIETYGRVRVLGHIPPLDPLTGAALRAVAPLAELHICEPAAR